jgi:hypothetical protein
MENGMDSLLFKFVSASRILRIFKFLKAGKSHTEFLRLTIAELASGMAIFRDITCFLLLGLMGFALVGVQLFRGSLAYTCTRQAKNTSSTNLIWPCPDTLACQAEASLDQMCSQLPQGAAELRLLGFDNIFHGLGTVTYMISNDRLPQTVPEALYNADATSASLASAFSMACVACMGLVGMKLMLALVAGALVNAQDKLNRQAHIDGIYAKFKMTREKSSLSGAAKVLYLAKVASLDQQREILLERAANHEAGAFLERF